MKMFEEMTDSLHAMSEINSAMHISVKQDLICRIPPPKKFGI